MIVCGHGDVEKYCEDKNMIIVERYDGCIEDYNGVSRVLVTDQGMTEGAYYSLKAKMLAKGVELVSIHYEDTPSVSEYIVHSTNESIQDRQKHTGRHQFGFAMKNGVKVHHEHNFNVAKTIIELRDKGLTLAKIQDDPEVKHPDGRKLSLSTINTIIKNRKDYEE